MTLDGKTLAVSLDTLAPHSGMRLDVANEYFGLTESSPGIVQAGYGQEHRPVYHYTFGALTADGVSIAKPVVALEGYADQEHCNGQRHTDNGPVMGTVRVRICHDEGDMNLACGT